MGFGRKGARQLSKNGIDSIAVSFTPEEVENVANFQAYGFLPELMARFTRFVPFQALDAGTLKNILRSSVLDRLTREFEDEGFKLHVGDEVMDHIVADSMKRETGARGLVAILTRHLEEAAFNAFAEVPGGDVVLQVHEGNIKVVVEPA